MDNPSQQQQSTQEAIARLAYQIWEERGRPQGSDVDFWLEAERQILSTVKPGAAPSTALIRPAASRALLAQPDQLRAKSAPVARTQAAPKQLTQAERDVKLETARTAVPAARPTQPSAGGTARR